MFEGNKYMENRAALRNSDGGMSGCFNQCGYGRLHWAGGMWVEGRATMTVWMWEYTWYAYISKASGVEWSELRGEVEDGTKKVWSHRALKTIVRMLTIVLNKMGCNCRKLKTRIKWSNIWSGAVTLTSLRNLHGVRSWAKEDI